jgi:hypothetical protein
MLKIIRVQSGVLPRGVTLRFNLRLVVVAVVMFLAFVLIVFAGIVLETHTVL